MKRLFCLVIALAAVGTLSFAESAFKTWTVAVDAGATAMTASIGSSILPAQFDLGM